MCIGRRRDPRQCIVPPHTLRVIEMRGDHRQSEMARALPAQGARVREERCEQATRDGDGFVARSFAEAAATRYLDRRIHDGERRFDLPEAALPDATLDLIDALLQRSEG